MNLRRSFLTLGASLTLLSAIPGQAAEGPRVDVVKILAFSCPVCRASETYDSSIERAVRATGGQYVTAPLAPGDSDNGIREQVYFSARSLNAQFGADVKASFYKAMQDQGLPLLSYPEIHSWLSRDLPGHEQHFKALFDAAQGAESRGALVRAARLASSMGVSSVPAYILLVDGHPRTLLEVENVPGNSLPMLKDEVLSRITSLSKK